VRLVVRSGIGGSPEHGKLSIDSFEERQMAVGGSKVGELRPSRASIGVRTTSAPIPNMREGEFDFVCPATERGTSGLDSETGMGSEMRRKPAFVLLVV